MTVRNLAATGEALQEGRSICQDRPNLFVAHPLEHSQAFRTLHHCMAMLVEKELRVEAYLVPSSKGWIRQTLPDQKPSKALS